MRSLRFVIGGADEETVIVAEEDGNEQFALRVDDALRSALTPPPPAPAAAAEERPAEQDQTEEIVLSPREIQIRVRAGEDPERLAHETGAKLSKVMRFAEAVVAERARVADEARRSRARREGDGVLVPFGETVDRRFSAHGVDAGGVAWDSFRRDDGTWVVTAMWHSEDAERRAQWTFSLGTRTLLPADEAAADLLSDRPMGPVVQAVPDLPGRHQWASDEDTVRLPSVAPGNEAVDGGFDAVDGVFDQEADYYIPPRPVGQPRPEPVPQQHGPQPPRRLEGVPALRLADPLPIFGDVDTDETDEDEIIPFTSFEPSAEMPVAVSPEPVRPVRRGSGRGKAAKEQTKIPSWDDILLGVRRKTD
jgi:Protein of unknown function (DUF3071)